MLDYQEKDISPDIAGYNEGMNKFIYFPELNGEKFDYLWADEDKTVLSEIDEAVEVKLKQFLLEKVNTLAAQKTKDWANLGIEYKTDVDTKEHTVNGFSSSYLDKAFKAGGKPMSYMAKDYIVNYMIFNANMQMMFMGHPAFFWKKDMQGTYTNLGKRLGGHNAPGDNQARNQGVPDTINYLILSDEEVSSKTMEYLEVLHSKNPKAIEAYRTIESTDAQEYTTLQEHLNFMYLKGHMTADTRDRLLDKASKETLNDEELGFILNPVKPVYFDNVYDRVFNLEFPFYVKSSSFPLIKQLTKGLEIDTLRQTMEDNSIDRAAYKSAIKLGSTNDGFYAFNRDHSNIEKYVRNVPRKGLRNQQEVPVKEKDEVSDGTQQRKLLFEGIRNLEIEKGTKGSQLEAEYNKWYGVLYKTLADELKDEVKWKRVAGRVEVDLESVQRLLQKEALTRGYNVNDIAGLTLLGDKKRFKAPMWFNGSGDKIEAVLNSIVKNRILKIKRHGHSYVLGSEAGFYRKGVNDPILEGEEGKKKIQRYSKNIVFTDKYDPDQGLLPAQVLPNGTFQPDQIMVRSFFKNPNGTDVDIREFAEYIDGKFILDFNKVPQDLLKGIGFRIPTASKNNMAYVEIVGFLPNDSGDLVIAPQDFTKRMGSDFDVDKLFSMFKNYVVHNDGIKEFNDEPILEAHNRILDIQLRVMGSSNLEVQRIITNPLDEGNLGELAETISKKVKGRGQESILDPTYQRDKYINGNSAKGSIGAFAVANVFNAVIQDKDIDILKPVRVVDEEKETEYISMIPLVITFGRKTSNELSTPTTNKGTSKGEQLSAYLSASVDNENLQILNNLNINNTTIPIVALLTQKGFTDEDVIPFINQDVIRAYTKWTAIVGPTRALSRTIQEFKLSEVVKEKLKAVLDSDLDNSRAYNNYGGEELLNYIGAKRDDHYKSVQADSLLKFVDLEAHGRLLGKAARVSNIDSSGIGKSYLESLDRRDDLLDIIESKRLKNIIRVFGQPVTDEFIVNNDISYDDVFQIGETLGFNGQTKPLYLRPTTIPGYAATYGLLNNVDMWQALFPYESTGFRRVLSSILTLSATGSLGSSARKTVSNDLKRYMMASNSNPIADEDINIARERLFFDREDSPSLGKTIRALQTVNFFPNNTFINRMKVTLGGSNNPTIIDFNSSKAENIDETSIFADFLKLYYQEIPINDDYNSRDLFFDLVKYDLLGRGVQAAKEYIKYMPHDLLRDLKVYDYIEDIDFNSPELLGMDENLFIPFVVQFFQHYPQHLRSYNSVKDYLNRESFKPPIFTVRDTSSRKGYKIYVNQGNDVPVEISVLGDNGFFEYYRTQSSVTQTSLVPANNPKGGVPTELKKKSPEVDGSTSRPVSVSQEVVSTKTKEELKTIAHSYGYDSKLSSKENFRNMLEYTSIHGKVPFYRKMSRVYLNKLDNLSDKVKLKFTTTESSSFSVEVDDQTGEIESIDITLATNVTETKFETDLLHELTHGFTVLRLENNSEAAKTLSELRRIYMEDLGITEAEIKRAIEAVGDDGLVNMPQKDRARFSQVYSVLNDYEFIAHAMTDSATIARLANLNDDRVKKWYDKILDFVKRILSEIFDLDSNSAFAVALDNVMKLIEEPEASKFVFTIKENNINILDKMNYISDEEVDEYIKRCNG